MNSHILVTGVAGFIGYHLTNKLLGEGHTVTGIDNLNDYYNVQLKKDRLSRIESERFSFIHGDLEDRNLILETFAQSRFDYVINLAAQAGVRYSLENPYAYIDSNIIGFLNILEACKKYPVKHLLYASSSSVYGGNTKIPFSESDCTEKPLSLYGATKKTNELMAYSYSYLYKIPATGLRFFTVYGPWGRPDMAMYIFTKAIFEGKPIKVFNYGNMKRDFTYVDDIIQGIIKLLDKAPGSKEKSDLPHKTYNIGNNNPESLEYFIEVLEKEIGKTAQKELLPLQPGDVIETFADITELNRDTGFKPTTSIERGIKEFVTWYRGYHRT